MHDARRTCADPHHRGRPLRRQLRRRGGTPHRSPRTRRAAARRPGAGLADPGAARSCSPPARTNGRIVFPDNDRPGVMLAGAARTYLRPTACSSASAPSSSRHHDSGHAATHALAAAGIDDRSRSRDTRASVDGTSGAPCTATSASPAYASETMTSTPTSSLASGGLQPRCTCTARPAGGSCTSEKLGAFLSGRVPPGGHRGRHRSRYGSAGRWRHRGSGAVGCRRPYVRRPAAGRDRRRRPRGPPGPGCARSSTSSATPPPAPRTTRARPPAC